MQTKVAGWLLLLLLALLAAHDTFALQDEEEGVPVRDIYPEYPRLGERVVCGEPQLYRLHGMRPDAVYDLKVSYPATLPTTFELRVERVVLPLPVAGAGPVAGPRRRVLNTAKLRLRPQEFESHESVRYRLESDGALQADVSLLALVEGVQRPNGAAAEQRQCHFDVALEELILEAFPHQTLALLAWLALLLLASARWVFPYLQTKVALARQEDRDVGMDTSKQS